MIGAIGVLFKIELVNRIGLQPLSKRERVLGMVMRIP